MNTRIPTELSMPVLVLIFVFLFVQFGFGQGYGQFEKGRMKDVLGVVKEDIKKNYYDPEFHGIDLDARFKKAEERLGIVTSVPQALAVIAQVLIDFNDSHLYFIPPPTNLSVQYGWKIEAIGDKCYITSVKPDSDAQAKGLKAGDQVLAISGFRPTRHELWKVLYYYNVISKRDSLTLKVLSPGDQTPRDLEIKSKIKKMPSTITNQNYFRAFDDFDESEDENDKHRFQTIGNIVIWRMPSFEYETSQVDSLMEKVKNGQSLILDLRGNGGGLVKTLERLAGYFTDKDIKISDLKGRKPMDQSVAKTRRKDVFHGKLIILLDHGSASASEVFARLMQLEQRGKVLGDLSAGAVMQARYLSETVGTDTIVPFGVSVTNADLIMSDGKSLENVGVVPDELILPTGADLAAGRDPVLARAVELMGAKISPEDAGKFFHYYWKKD